MDRTLGMSMAPPLLRLLDSFPPLIIRYSLAGMSYGRSSPPSPIRMAGQMMEWNGMLSFPMK